MNNYRLIIFGDDWDVYLTAYKDLSIRICKRKGRWVGIVKLNGHEIMIQKLFAQMKTVWLEWAHMKDLLLIMKSLCKKQMARANALAIFLLAIS